MPVSAAIARMLLFRTMTAIPLIFLVVAVTFAMVRLAPGDPAYILAGDTPSDEFVQQIREAYGLNKSIPEQFVLFLQKAVTGDFGTSVYYKRPVFEVILDRFPATLLLTGTAMIVAMIIGTTLGVLSAQTKGTSLDACITFASLVGFSIPVFWVGQLLVLFFAIQLGWLPVGGMESVRRGYTGFAHVMDVGWHLILPVCSLAVYLLAMIARVTRTAMVDALDRDFVTVAQAKGLSRTSIVWNHAFRVAIVSTVTIIGLEFGTVVVGAVLTETIFSWPGLGRLFYDAISKRDFPLLTGTFIFMSVMVVIVNALTDVVCAILDPRLRR